MRYFITLSYDGTNYHGWQIQPNADSIQARLNDALTKLLPVPTECVGAGRTDTGVHASMMVAHFDTDAPIDPEQMAFRLNRILPQDIAVQRVQQVDEHLHARFDAKRRTYHLLCLRPQRSLSTSLRSSSHLRSRLRTDEPCSGNFARNRRFH